MLACTLALGCVSTAGLSGNSHADASGDAPLAKDATREDSGAHGGDAAHEAAHPRDASAGDGPRLPWCRTREADTLCDDFDEGPLAQRWTLEKVADAGVIVLNSDASVSPPNSVFMYSSAAEGYGVSLSATLPAGTHVRCEFELFVEQAGSALSDVFLLTVNAPEFHYYALALSVSGTASALTEIAQFNDAGANFMKPYPFQVFVPGQWTAVAIAVTLPDRVTVEINGTTVVSKALGGPADGTSAGVSLAAFGELSPITDRFDNVACQVSP